MIDLDSDSFIRIFILLGLLGASAYFSASETALMSLSKIRIRQMAEEGIDKAQLLQKLMEKPEKLLGAILIGNNVVNIGASALATSLAIDFFGNAGVGIATGIMTLLVLIFGEITPKSIAVAKNESVALKVAGSISFIVRLLNPLIIALSYGTRLLIKLLGGDLTKKVPFITEAELKTMVDVGHEEGILETGERAMLHNVFRFGDLQVKDVMMPRTQVVAIEVDASYEKVMKVYKNELFSRMPVYRKTIDNIIGVLHIKDILFLEPEQKSFQLVNFVRKTYYTFESKRIAELFDDLRKKRLPFAVVADEYGGTAGIITMQDLIEEIFGEIADESDEETEAVQQVGEKEYLFSGTTRLELINAALESNLKSSHSDTIGGYIAETIGRFPLKGEHIRIDEIEFIILDTFRHRINRIHAKKIQSNGNYLF